MKPIFFPVPGGTAAISRPECCLRTAAGLAMMGAVLTGMVFSPVLLFGLSLTGVYLMHTVVMRRDPIYYLAARLHVHDRVQLWEYLGASAVLMIIVKGGHVHGALTVLMFFSYAAFLAIAALINRDGTAAPRDHSPDAALSRGGRGFTARPAVVYAGTRGRGRSPGRPCE